MFFPLHAGILLYDIRAFRWRAPLLSSPSYAFHDSARSCMVVPDWMPPHSSSSSSAVEAEAEAAAADPERQGEEGKTHLTLGSEWNRGGGGEWMVFSLTGFFLLLLLRHPHALSQRWGKGEDTNLKTTAVQSFYSFSPLLPTPSSSVPFPPPSPPLFFAHKVPVPAERTEKGRKNRNRLPPEEEGFQMQATDNGAKKERLLT